jgi:molecular chaperone DnaK (HSP70)
VKAAIVVGCSRYDDPDVGNLQYAHSDAVRVADRLIAVGGVEPDLVITLHDAAEDVALRPTRDNVLTALTSLVHKLPDGAGMLYFFFSGHGFHSPADDADYLLLANSSTGAMEETSLRFDLVLRLLAKARATHVVLFLDACRATVSAGKSVEALIPQPDVTNLTPPGYASFCSCEPGTLSYEADELGAGIFSAALCDALDETGRCVSVEDLDRYLGHALPALSKRTGRPVQRAHTRVEPLGVKDVEIVSPRVRNMWRTASAVGEELRPPAQASSLSVAPDVLVSIDLGTSYSAAALWGRDGAITLAPAADGRTMIPSVISFLPDLDYRVGAAAMELELHDPARTIWHVKRHLGTGRMYQIGDKSVSAELVASLLVRSLRDNVSEAAGYPVRRCMTAYPANFSIRQTNALLRVFELAGLDVVRMIGEPNIAALLLERARPGLDATGLIVDLGGGTFDVAVAEFAEEVCEIKSVAGDNELGGLDYDEAILGLIRRRLTEGNPHLLIGGPLLAALRREAERAKRALGTRTEAIVYVGGIETETGLGDTELVITRDDVREACRHLDAKVRQVVTSALTDADAREDPDLVLLAGQGAKIFTVREAIETALGDARPEFIDQFQELAVVHGLASYSQVMQGHAKDLLLLDLTHRGLAIECPQLHGGGRMLLDRLTTIPTKRSEILLFDAPAGTPLTCTIVERSKTADETVPIGQITVPAPRNDRDLGLEFALNIDANSMILLSVTDAAAQWRADYQLNQLYRHADPLRPGERANLLLDGWTLSPIHKLRDDESGAPESAETIRTADIQRLYTEVNAERTELDLVLAREADVSWSQAPYRAEVARVAEARLLNRAGRYRDALSLATSSLRKLASRGHVALAGQACAAACEAIGGLPKAGRAELAGQVAALLIPALSGQDRYHDRAGIVAACARDLKGIGAKREAARLTAAFPETGVPGAAR